MSKKFSSLRNEISYRLSVKSIFTVQLISQSMHIAQITAHNVKFEQKKAENFRAFVENFVANYIVLALF